MGPSATQVRGSEVGSRLQHRSRRSASSSGCCTTDGGTGVTIGPPGLLLLLVLLVPVIPGLVTTIDVSSRPDWAFERAGTSKTLGIVMAIAGVDRGCSA